MCAKNVRIITRKIKIECIIVKQVKEKKCTQRKLNYHPPIQVDLKTDHFREKTDNIFKKTRNLRKLDA